MDMSSDMSMSMSMPMSSSGMSSMSSMTSSAMASSSSSMDMSDSSMDMSMNTFFTAGDGPTLWFKGWTPASSGATFGVCVGLFVIAIIARLLAAFGSLIDSARWHQTVHGGCRTSDYCDNNGGATPQMVAADQEKSSSANTLNRPAVFLPSASPRRMVPPFSLKYDGAKGLLALIHSFIIYLLMLAVMSYSPYYLVAIILGTAAGETVFGRFSTAHWSIDHH